MTSQVQTGTIRTKIPARLDRLPWSKFHWKVVIGLGAVWSLDGLEVTMVGVVASKITEADSGLGLTSGQVGIAGAIYIVGACLGALFFGQLTDRLGRKKLFIITLAVYLAATFATAFATVPWFFYAARFFTGAGIGGEYAAINSAIDELIPARMRGNVDLVINGTYWFGAAIGAFVGGFILLSPGLLPDWLGWRLAFGFGVVLGFLILLVRRNVPESPRWMFIHGKEDQAEQTVERIENEIKEETGKPLAEPDRSITVRQRKSISFREIGRTAFKLYPKRSVLGVSLFTGQAFIYNGITFNLGLLVTTFFGISDSLASVFFIIYAVSNFLGPVTLGRLFDTVGRIPMIAGCYLGSSLLTVPLIFLFLNGLLGAWTFLGFILGIFFLASAGASAAYLTVSEIFPMETRALAIAFFYAIGTAAGGIAGPLLFGQLIGTGQVGNVVIAFAIGAAVMAIGGIVELFFGVRAEQANLEDIAKPLTAEEAEQGGPESGAAGSDQQREARECRQDAERERSRAAEHRAVALELQARAPRAYAGQGGTPDSALDTASGANAGPGGTEAQRQREEEALAELAELRAAALDEQATAHELLAEASGESGEHPRAALRARAQAAEQRARGYNERARAADADSDADGRRHNWFAEAADERAREREQWALAERCRAEAEQQDDTDAVVSRARAEMHERWAARHEATARAHDARAEGDDRARERADGEAAEQEDLALAAEQRVISAEHRAGADAVRGELEQTEAARQEEAERERRTQEREERIRERVQGRERTERAGLRRFAPGPGELVARGRSGGLDPRQEASVEQVLDQEIDVIARALNEHGPADRAELAQLVGARYWGPGRFGQALRAAVNEGRVQRLSRRTYGPPNG